MRKACLEKRAERIADDAMHAITAGLLQTDSRSAAKGGSKPTAMNEIGDARDGVMTGSDVASHGCVVIDPR